MNKMLAALVAILVVMNVALMLALGKRSAVPVEPAGAARGSVTISRLVRVSGSHIDVTFAQPGKTNETYSIALW